MIDEKQISDTIRKLYEAALNGEGWESALTSLGKSVGCFGADLYYCNLEQLTIPKMYATKFPDENALRDYASYYASQDPRFGYVLDNPDKLTFYDDDVMPMEQREKSEFFVDWEWKVTDQAYAFGAILTKMDDLLVAVSLGRNNDAGRPSKAEDYVFQRLIPHIQRAVQLGEVIEVQKLEHDALMQAAELNRHGVIVLDQNGDVMDVNYSAQKIISAGDAILLLGRKLSIFNPFDNKHFNGIIKSVLEVDFLNSGSGGRMSLSRKNDHLPYHVLISPLPQSDSFKSMIRRPTVMVVLSDPDGHIPTKKALHQLFQFTPREAELAILLMSGENLNASALKMKISHYTVSTYLKNMYQKTGAHSLSALIAILMKC